MTLIRRAMYAVLNKQARHRISKSRPVALILRFIDHWGLGDDVFIASYPRSGNTWLRFLLYELTLDGNAGFRSVHRTLPAVGRHHQAPRVLHGTQRILKTHEQFHPAYTKAIWLVRDIRDVAISEYYFHKWQDTYHDEFDVFLDQFLRGEVNRYGSWQAHTKSWLDAQQRAPDKILLVRFEEMRADPVETLRAVTAFLNLETTLADIQQAVANNSIEAMREKERDELYRPDRPVTVVRKGEVGGWQGILTRQQVERIEASAGELMRQLAYETCT
jgi:hypothetical protein